MQLLLGAVSRDAVASVLGTGAVHVPAQFDAEVFAAVRRELQRNRVSLPEALNALFALRSLTAERHAITDLLLDAVALRDRFGAHDVFYAILAHRLDGTLVTSDAGLARAATGYVEVAYVGRGALATSS